MTFDEVKVAFDDMVMVELLVMPTICLTLNLVVVLSARYMNSLFEYFEVSATDIVVFELVAPPVTSTMTEVGSPYCSSTISLRLIEELNSAYVVIDSVSSDQSFEAKESESAPFRNLP